MTTTTAPVAAPGALNSKRKAKARLEFEDFLRFREYMESQEEHNRYEEKSKFFRMELRSKLPFVSINEGVVDYWSVEKPVFTSRRFFDYTGEESDEDKELEDGLLLAEMMVKYIQQTNDHDMFFNIVKAMIKKQRQGYLEDAFLGEIAEYAVIGRLLLELVPLIQDVQGSCNSYGTADLRWIRTD